MKCLIVAAGQGTRLREKLELKPLIQLRGMALIEHVIVRARVAGIDEFVVVSGYRGDELRAALDEISARVDVPITHVENDEWARSNGVSVLKAKAHLGAPFILTMCDHLIDAQILRGLMQAPLEADGVMLAVDFNIVDPLNDPDDVTRVRTEDGRIRAIGKLMPEFDCFDTGVFLCSPAMFEALEESQSLGDDSISGAMNVLARRDRATVFDVQDKAWIDVDDLVAYEKAERLLDAKLL
ncbi:NTP transferase domain-containing protein [Lichenicola sp.]|uniref:phosphocholine cytidylyltransferase family protein n=1 Tax=Lichenicola sp. TaxID=2804529 RepID=UPI003AFFA321